MILDEERIGRKNIWLRRIKKLYRTSFPRKERMSFSLLLKGTSSQMTDLTAYFYKGEFVGFTYTVSDGELAYLFYFAIEADKRSAGFGSQTIAQLKSKYAIPIALDVEATGLKMPDEDLRTRRKAFYCRNGFAAAGFGACYRGVRYETLCCGECPDKARLKQLFAQYRQTALGKRVKK